MLGSDTKHAVPQDSMYWLCDRRAGIPHRRVSLQVTRNGQPTKVRTYHSVPRMGPNHDLGVFNTGVDTVERALLERYFLVKVGEQYHPPLQTRAQDWAMEHLKAFQDRVVELVSEDAVAVTLRQVVEAYSGAKRRIYENAYRSLYRYVLCRKDADLCPFPKFEKQSLLKAPRIINPRSARYNLVLGKYLKTNEKLYYKAINKVWDSCTTHTVIKGLNVFDQASVMRAKWDRFSAPVALGLDATKFDMHVSAAALRYEHEYYNRVFQSKELRKLLNWQVYNRGVARCPDGEVKFSVEGTRSSGDLNTSLGNCILMCSLLYGLCAVLGVDAELANNGDDCVLIFEQEHLQRVLEAVPSFFKTYGFRMTVEEPVYTFEEIEFCQSKPVHLARGWCMVRNVRTCLMKDPICLHPVQNDKVWRKWLAAVGECGMSLVPGCPVLQEFYGCFMRNGTKANERFKSAVFKNTSMIERGSGLECGPQEITDDARASFYRATGITPDYQIALEEYFRGFSIGGIQSANVSVGLMENAPPAFIRHL